MYSLVVLDGQQPEKRNSLLHFFRFSAARDVEGDLANLKHRWRQQAAFSSAAAALTPSSGGTTHQAPFLLAFNPSSESALSVLILVKSSHCIPRSPSLHGITMVNKQQYIANWYLKENVCVCVQSYLIWKEHYEWFDIYYRFRVIYVLKFFNLHRIRFWITTEKESFITDQQIPMWTL